MKNKIERIQNTIKENKFDAFLITNLHNLFYLTGIAFHQNRDAFLLVTTEQTYLITNPMYKEYSERKIDELGLSVELLISDQKKSIYDLINSILKQDAKLGVEEHNLLLIEGQKLKEKLKGVEIINSEKLIEKMREIKDEVEIELLKTVAGMTDKILEDLIDWLKNERTDTTTEFDVVEAIRLIMRKYEISSFSFGPIIATASGSSEPHYGLQMKPIENNAPLLIDLGFMHKGYCSDTTITVFVGKPSAEFKKNYEIVRECSNLCLSKVKSGIDFYEIQEIAEEFFKRHNVNDNFIHSIGHGLGIEVHELPHVMKEKQKFGLKENSVITIEPGLYFPGKYGTRIEDTVVVRKDKGEVISKFPKELLVV